MLESRSVRYPNRLERCRLKSQLSICNLKNKSEISVMSLSGRPVNGGSIANIRPRNICPGLDVPLHCLNLYDIAENWLYENYITSETVESKLV